MTAYTVTDTHGCKVIDRPIPVTDCVALMQAWEKAFDNPADTWVCDSVLAAHFRAALVVGPKSATEAWRAELGLDANSF